MSTATENPIRGDFSILKREFRERPLVYLDSAATTQKPDAVIDAVAAYYRNSNANVHRAAHVLAEEATAALEQARDSVKELLNAACREEIIFTRGTTESINLITNCINAAFDRPLQSGDEILISEMEHHSNIVPWQLLCQRTGASLRAIRVTTDGELDLEDFHNKLGTQTKIVSINHVSNALGTVNPAEDIVAAARQVGAITVLDGAQAVLHHSPDVQALNCDFYAFSGHKMFAPTGIGVLYGRLPLLEAMSPWQAGGEMIETVRLSGSTYQQPPFKFEAGTPNIGGAVGLHAAIRYLGSLDLPTLIAAENTLIQTALSGLQQIPEVSLVGTPRHRSAVISFQLAGAHPQDVGTLLDQQGVAVRTGHHCAMPLMEALGIPGTVRASFSLYNDASDVDRLLTAVDKATTFL